MAFLAGRLLCASLLLMTQLLPGPAVVAAAPVAWPPSAAGFTGKIKTMWFGANHTGGLDSRDTLALMAKHDVAGYGWQTAVSGQSGAGGGTDAVGRGDALGSSAVASARAYMATAGRRDVVLFQYRQVQVALRLYAQNALAADRPDLAGFFLHNSTSGALCVAQQPWGTADPYWDFRNASAVEYWVERVIGQVARDPAMQGGPSAVFFDEVDQGTCGYHGGTCDLSRMETGALQAASNAMLPRMVGALNERGIVPILSSDNRMRASGSGLSNLTAPCALAQDATVTALANLTWVRFYEDWPGSSWVGHGPDVDAVMIENALLEGEASVPNALHGRGTCKGQRRNITRPGRLGGEIEFLVASYLVVASEGSVLSVSHGWYDEDFCWWPEYDVVYGTPLGPAVRTGSYSWYRNYTRANAEIDVSAGRAGAVVLLA